MYITKFRQTKIQIHIQGKLNYNSKKHIELILKAKNMANEKNC